VTLRPRDVRPVDRARLWLFAAALALSPQGAWAAAAKKAGAAAADIGEAADSNSFASRPLVLIVALAALGFVPFVLLMVTSFVKISVVLSIVRSAMGTQQIPPTQVITGLAIILTVYIMSPVGQAMYRAAEINAFESGEGVLSSKTVEQLFEAGKRAKEPLRDFLLKKVTTKDRALFYGLAIKMRKTPEEREGITDRDFLITVPAFVVSELKEAFQIGFLLFVPFIVIDMVVANILLALGMHMLSPTTISMPFKLLLFVMVDGWYLIAKGLVVGYM
jgi:type III secretion protein R